VIEPIGLNSRPHDGIRRLATYASVAVAIMLIAAKLAAFFFTGSIAVLSSLLDSTLDLIGAMITLFGVASALKPPDHDHRFGHGKAEPLAALAQAAFIAGSSVLLSYEALSRFYQPQGIEHEVFGYVVMTLAIVLSAVLVAFQNYVVRHTASMAIGADRTHYIGDIVVNAAVMAAFGLYQLTGYSWFDPLFAILIAGGLTFNAYRIAGKALHVLMDRELPDSDRESILSIARQQPQVRGVHDLRTRTDGERIFIEFHLELDGNMPLATAHRIDESIMNEIRKAFPAADILVHQDPAGLTEERLDEQIEVRAAHK
jgi:ferrous-iron efflux pump FieF